MEVRDGRECKRYVEAELIRVLQSRPEWSCATAPASVPESYAASRGSGSDVMAWKLSKSGTYYQSWYRLEAHLARHEFLIWFGNHQMGDAGLHWIMRPALHVAFEDLEPMEPPFVFHFRLRDVLQAMIESLDRPGGSDMRFDLNDYSIT